jgi:hypothetical protein
MISLAAALVVTLSTAGCTLPGVGARPFDPGERLTYDIEAMGVTRRRAVALAVEPGSGATLGLAASVRFRAPFTGVRGSARSLIDGRSLRGHHYRDESNDGTSASTDAQLDRDGLATRVYWANGSKSGMTAFLKNGAVLDVVSALYFLRAANLSPGDEFCFGAVGGRTYWRVSGHAAATERIRTRAGHFEALRLDGVAVKADDPSRRYLIHVWISADPHRLPVRLSVETSLGRVEAALSHKALAVRRSDPFDHQGTPCVGRRNSERPRIM